MKTVVLILGFIAISAAVAAPSHHSSEEHDRYNPLIQLLKQLRRRDRYQNYYNKAETSPVVVVTSAPVQDKPLVDQIDTRIVSNPSSISDGALGTPDQIKQILAESSLQQKPQAQVGSFGTGIPASGGAAETLPLDLSNLGPSGTKVPPQRIDQINRGVSTILGGVRNASLNDILRGSFMFTRNENVRTVANNVLDAIFGRRGQ